MALLDLNIVAGRQEHLVFYFQVAKSLIPKPVDELVKCSSRRNMAGVVIEINGDSIKNLLSITIV